MMCPVEITVGNRGIFFKTDDIKDIVPVCYFPGINIFVVFVSVVPEKKSIPHKIRCLVMK